MNVPVCVCCGQPIARKASSQRLNPNICAACSDLADGLEVLNQPPAAENNTIKIESTKERRPIRKAA